MAAAPSRHRFSPDDYTSSDGRRRPRLPHAPEFEYVIINEEFDTALAQLEAIVTASRLTYEQQALRHRDQFANLGVPV